MLRRTGLIATLFAGLGLLGASLHGMTRVDETLRVAAAAPAPQVAPHDVLERHQRDCDRKPKGPRV